MTAAALTRFACLTALAIAAPWAQASIVSDASGTYEEVRFYTPASSSVSTTQGNAETGSDLCAGSNVCASGLLFDSVTAGQIVTYGDSSTSADSLVNQNLSASYAGLGVITQNSQGVLSTDTAINQGEYLSLYFQQPVTVLGFVFFDVNNQSFASGTTISLIVDEVTYKLSASDTTLLSSIKGQEFTFVGGETAYYLGAVKLAAAVPEPGTWALSAIGLLGLAAVRRRHRR
jgi:hypothetical protein